MSTHPRLEARVSALERRQLNLETHVEELADDITASIKHLSDDMTASFKQLAAYQIETEHRIDTRFNKIENRLDKIEATMATKDDLATLSTNIKNDMTAMEGRILDAFKQVLATINLPHPSTE
jgi:chromosome segregation ATPase